MPTRRSTAEAFQILISHAFGDAGSPYMIGLISEALKTALRGAESSSLSVSSDGLHSLIRRDANATYDRVSAPPKSSNESSQSSIVSFLPFRPTTKYSSSHCSTRYSRQVSSKYWAAYSSCWRPPTFYVINPKWRRLSLVSIACGRRWNRPLSFSFSSPLSFQFSKSFLFYFFFLQIRNI